jgi:EmrB/QacA subfamily drug resistance transporter
MSTTLDIGTPMIATEDRRRWLALAILATASFLVVVDTSTVNIAMPSIGADLGMEQSLMTWVVTAYVLPFGGLLLLGGRLADRFGHRLMFLCGLLGFVVASTAAGLSLNGSALLTARAVQGASAALLTPAALSILTQLFASGPERAKALGLWGAVAGLGGVAGVVLGGMLTASYGWAAIFFINVPIGLVAVVLTPMLIRPDTSLSAQPLDLPGALTATASISALVLSASLALDQGLFSPLPLASGLAGAALLSLFVIIERRSSHPLVPLSLFRQPGVLIGNLAMAITGGVTVGIFFFLSLHMQNVLGFDEMTTGLSQLPVALSLIFAAGLVPPMINRLGATSTLSLSLLALAAGLVWLAAAPIDAQFTAHLFGPSVLIGTSLSGAFISATDLALHRADSEQSGLVSGLVNTSQQIGGALGLAALAAAAGAVSSAAVGAGVDPVVALEEGYSLAYLVGAGLALFGAGATLIARPQRGAEGNR